MSDPRRDVEGLLETLDDPPLCYDKGRCRSDPTMEDAAATIRTLRSERDGWQEDWEKAHRLAVERFAELERRDAALREARGFIEEAEAIFAGEFGSDWGDHFGPALEALMRYEEAARAFATGGDDD